MNNITLIGTLGKDAEKKEFGENTVFEFSMAVNGAGDKKGEDGFYESAWIRVKYWTKNPGRTPELVKGTRVVVNGKLRESKWETEGVPKSMFYAEAREIHAVQKTSSSEATGSTTKAVDISPKSDEYDPFQ